MQQYDQPPRVSAGKVILFAGVIMPAISITVEATTHICAEFYFDPIPTFWHLALVIFVPLAQLQVWFAIRRCDPNRLKLAGLLNAAALGISIFYSIIYIPLLPLAALTILIALGLLPLAPFLSLLAACLMRKELKKVAAIAPPTSFALRFPGLLAGFAFTIAVVGILELPEALTRYGLQMAASTSLHKRAEGIRFLRSYGSKEYLLRSCYNQSGAVTGLLTNVYWIRNPVHPAKAREIYYRVTGETFDSSAPPHRVVNRLLSDDIVEFDRNQGETTIGGKLRGLSLAESKLEGSMDADGGVGYMQWTLTFQNASEFQREARSEIQLPPGAVVSRLTLWVNGQEREAAFAARQQVRQAYQQVVQQRRDPVLVTTAGRDRILVQCFPVPPYHGQMKIRIGITVPLVLEDTAEKAWLMLPHFASRNFEIPDDVKHSVWINATHPLGSGNGLLGYVIPSNTGFQLQGQFTDADLLKPESAIQLNRFNRDSAFWSPNPFEVESTIVKQSLEERTPAHLRRIVVVVDTSASMAVWARQIGQALHTLPTNIDLQLVLADGEWLHESQGKNIVAAGIEGVSWALKNAEFAGGADNGPALKRAWDLATEETGNNAIVWIHSPQLVPFESIGGLIDRSQRPFGPSLYSVKTRVGPDEIEKRLDGINEVKSVVRLGSLRSDLERLFGQLSGRKKTLEFVRSLKHTTSSSIESEGFQTSAHLARLWANDEVARMLNARDESLKFAATELAVRYQLVTPVSGAVVLENDQQYRNAGLKPVDAGTVPTIPEPEIVSLLIAAVITIAWLICVKRRPARSGGCPI